MNGHERLREHLQSKQVNCASISLLALNQGILPDRRDEVEAITNHTSQIELIGICAALDMYIRKQAVCVIHTMSPDKVASVFLSDLHNEAVSDPEGAYFFGGLVRMRYLFNDTGTKVDHVVAVTEINPTAKTATVVDVAGELIGHELITQVSFDKLNDMVIKDNGFAGGRVVALTGIPFEHSLVEENQELIAACVDEWKEIMGYLVKKTTLPT